MINSFVKIIDLWGSPANLAQDIDEKHFTVRKWRQRGSIPSPYWQSLIKAAKLKAENAKTKKERVPFEKITAELLVKLGSQVAA